MKNTPPVHKIEVDGLTIAEAIIGDTDKPPVLMLHGWGADIGLVWQLAVSLSLRGYCVYTLDLPGFGESDLPPVAWSVDDYVKFVLTYMQYHQLQQVHLFGHSFGGRLSLVLGSKHSTQIDKIVLTSSAGIRPKTPFFSNLRLQTYKHIRDGLKSVGLKNLSESLRQRYNKRYGSSDFQDSAGVMRETFIKVVNQDLLPYAKDIKRPTMLLWGENDQDTPLWMGKKLAETIPDSGLHIFPKSGHYAYLENLEQTVNVMHALFSQTG